jgi:hypothetical protein
MVAECSSWQVGCSRVSTTSRERTGRDIHLERSSGLRLPQLRVPVGLGVRHTQAPYQMDSLAPGPPDLPGLAT